MDDTVYNEKEYVMQAMLNVAKYIHEDRNDLKVEDLYKRLLDILEEDGRGKIFNRICQEENILIPVMDLVNAYRDTIPKARPYEDTKWLIDYLKEKNIKIGLITDGNKFVQRRKIEGLQIEELFNSIVVTDEFDLSKPDEEVFRISLEQASIIDPSEAVYIGDNPTKDFIGAKNIGMHTIRIKREVGDHMQTKVDAKLEAEHTITNMKEVVELCQI